MLLHLLHVTLPLKNMQGGTMIAKTLKKKTQNFQVSYKTRNLTATVGKIAFNIVVKQVTPLHN